MSGFPHLISMLALCVGFAFQSNAATTLVNTVTLNGSFESGTGTTTITNWIAATGSSLQRQNNYATNGAWSLVVGMDASSIPVGAMLNTGYQFIEGDVFTISFDARGGLNADNTDQIAWTIFYTSDNTATGTKTVVFTGNQTLLGATGDVSTSPNNASGTITTGSVGAAAAGKTLFVSFTPSTGIITNEFVRVDNLVLSVSSVPEPGPLAFLAIATLPLMRRQRC